MRCIHTGMHIQPLSEKTLEQALDVIEASFGNKRGKHWLSAALNREGHETLYDTVRIASLHFWTGEHEGNVIATTSLMRRTGQEYRGILWWLCVHPDYQGQGHGAELLAFSENAARELRVKEIQLAVRQHNSRALQLYTKNGFTVFGEDGAVLGLQKYLT